jgi:hypothetical protein
MIFANYNPESCIRRCRSLFVLETFFCRNLKNDRMSFLADVMLRQSCVRASRASPDQKWHGLRLVCSKNFSRATFFVFWVIYI